MSCMVQIIPNLQQAFQSSGDHIQQSCYSFTNENDLVPFDVIMFTR